MIKTFAQLKRDLQVGKKLTMTFNVLAESSEAIASRLNKPRFIVGTQTNGITLSESKDAPKGSFLELPRASLVEYEDNTIKVYDPAIRDLTEQEKDILKNIPSYLPENKEQCERDIMTDTNTTYWLDKRYTKEEDAEWNWTTSKGLYYMRSEQKMRDASIKGDLSIVYTLTN